MVEIAIKDITFLGSVDTQSDGEVYVYFSDFAGTPKTLTPNQEFYLRIYRIIFGLRGKNLILFSPNGLEVIDFFDERFLTDKIVLIDKHYAGIIKYRVKVESNGRLPLAKAQITTRFDSGDVNPKGIIIGIFGILEPIV